MWVSGPVDSAMCSVTILRYLAGSWSAPVDVSDWMLLSSHRTSLNVTGRK